MADPINFPVPRVGEARASTSLPLQTLHALLDENVGATIAMIGRDLRFLHTNSKFASWFGLVPADLTGRPIADFYGEQNAVRYLPYLERAFAGEEVRYQRQVRSSSGVEEWHTICLTPCRDDAGEVFAIITAALDVHELRVTSDALRTANQRLSSHMENSPLAVIEIDSDLRIVYCSARGHELFGWRPGAAQGRLLPELLGTEADHAAGLGAALARLRGQLETRNRCSASHLLASGATIHCEWFSSAVTDPQGKLLSIMALVEDVSDKVDASRRLEVLAQRDSLTGLLNRSAFQGRLDDSIVRVQDQSGGGALLFIDLDGFKNVNDNHGHAAGDEVLREVARRIGEAVRAGDTVARIGGDEFAVLLDADIDASTAGEISRRILAALEPPFEFGAIGASIGVASYPPPDGQSSTLMKLADGAMYRAKRSGKGCVRYAEVG